MFKFLAKVITAINKEAIISWLTIKSNIDATIIPGTIFTIGAIQYANLSWEQSLIKIGMALVYFFFYIRTFDESNQLSSIEEDRANKPHRPLVTGLITIEQARKRFVVSMVIFFLLGLFFDVLWWTLLWQLTTLWNNQLTGSRNWLKKSATISLGILAQLGAAWNLVGPVPPEMLQLIIFLCFVNPWIVVIQDLRDIDGDKNVGRKTFPILYGVTFTRWIMCLSYIFTAIISHFYIFAPLELTHKNVTIIDVLTIALLIIIALRLVTKTTVVGDRLTYRLYIAWYIITLTSPIWIY
jgi:4-hydroxybenzoate polyprenyltransferase